MRKTSETKVIFGVLIWLAIVGLVALWAQGTWATTGKVAVDLSEFLSTPYRPAELQFEREHVLRTGVPIFLENDGQTRLVGRVTRVEELDSTEKGYVITDKAFVDFFADAPGIDTIDKLTYHETPQSFAWVIEMMLPPETREEIGALIIGAYQDHQKEIVSAYRPIVEQSLRDATEIIREDLRASIENHEADFQKLGDRFQKQLVEEKIVPLVQNEIWPIVRKEAEPLVTEIGQEMWKEVSVWRFTWKYLYDKSPLPEKNLTQKEFQKFVDTKAAPILESHIGDIVEVQQSILKNVAQSEKVKATVSESFRQVSGDEDVQKLLTQLFREVFVNNQRLEAVMRENWNSPDAQRAMAMTNRKLDPVITQIGQTLFGSPNEEITPEFSRVLRNKILQKDDRWLMIQTGMSEIRKSENGLPIIKVSTGETGIENPFHVTREVETQ